MAFRALHLRMLPKQQKFCFRMVELPRRGYLLPTDGRVTRIARLRERPMMRITMAIGTFGKGHPGELSGTSRFGRSVTLCASDLGVQSRERKPRFGMIDFRRGFPVDEIVTLQTVFSQLAMMHVLVTGDAILR